MELMTDAAGCAAGGKNARDRRAGNTGWSTTRSGRR